jgi:HlyD family secretion protein
LRRWLVFASVSLLVIGSFVFFRARATPKEQRTRWSTAAVRRGDLTATVTANGNLRARGAVRIGAEVSGRVVSVAADFNGVVRLGQVLAEIDTTQVEAALRQAKAQLVAARADVASRSATATEARQSLERTKRLAANNSATPQQVDAETAAASRAEAALATATAQVELAEAAVVAAQSSAQKARIRSPLDGVVLQRDVEVGQVLATAMGAPTIFTVARPLTTLEAVLSIDEADVGRVRQGQPVFLTVDAWPGQRFEGALGELHDDAVIRNSVVTYTAIVTVPNAELRLKPGMTVTATIETEKRVGVLLLPNTALRYRPPDTARKAALGAPPDSVTAAVLDGKARVFRLEHGQPQEVVVELGLTDGLTTELRSKNLKEGDALIIDAEEVAP